MSITTKVECAGLARDAAPEIGSKANGLRRAENVVLRSPGVLETRPSFDLLTEDITDRRVRALREFQGRLVYVWQDTNDDTWGLSDEDGATFDIPTVARALAPPDYDASETQFAEARASLHGTGLQGPWVCESAVPIDGGVRLSGVRIRLLTQPIAATGTGSTLEPALDPPLSFAYRFVIKRTDSTGYVRRSPPSARYLLTATKAPYVFGQEITVLLGDGLAAGDEIEMYRTIAVEGLSVQPEHFLAYAYTLTAADVLAGLFVMPTDTTPEGSLGAQLYTDAAQLTAVAAKFPPPQARALAHWASCMWFGNTKTQNRLQLQLVNLFYAGIALYYTNQAWDAARPGNFTAASTVVGMTITDGLAVGMPITDNVVYGPLADGVYIPAETYIASITPGVSITMTNPAFASNSNIDFVAYPPVYSVSHPNVAAGLMAFTLNAATYVNGSTAVTLTGTAVTTGLRPGMYVATNSATIGGSATASTFLTAGTKIDEITGINSFTITQPALSGGSSITYAGDVVTVNAVDFYAWAGDDLVSPTSAFTVPYRIFQIGSPTWGRVAVGFAVQNLCQLLNAYYLAVDDFVVYATPGGDVWDFAAEDFADDGLRVSPGTLAATFVLESDYEMPITVDSSCRTAFSPMLPKASEDDYRPNRLHFSDLDEPESVPLLNFINVGSEQSAIMALVPLRNALLVFKQDGLWRVTGYGPSSWTVDPLDPTLRLLRPESVVASQNKAYAWAIGGISEVDETSSRSISAGRLDVELRDFSEFITSEPTTHGAMAICVEQRNIVMFGVPAYAGADATSRVYVWCQTTGAWTEWPMEWGHACGSASFDRAYYSRPPEDAKPDHGAIDIEIRRMTEAYRGFDRTYDLGPGTTITGDFADTVVTVLVSEMGTWQPAAGGWISATDGATRVYRRILTAVYNDVDAWVCTLEASVGSDASSLMITDAGDFFVTDGGSHFLIADLSGWQAHEGFALAVEWHPTAPARLPTGAICRELQMQLDLRAAPDPVKEDSIPEYIVGGSSERDTAPVTFTSNMDRTATVQPLRVGVSRQVARGATIAPYFQTSDIFAVRLVGASIVHEGVSERTRR